MNITASVRWYNPEKNKNEHSEYTIKNVKNIDKFFDRAIEAAKNTHPRKDQKVTIDRTAISLYIGYYNCGNLQDRFYLVQP